MSWTCPTCKREQTIIGDYEDLTHLRRAVGRLKGELMEKLIQYEDIVPMSSMIAMLTIALIAAMSVSAPLWIRIGLASCVALSGVALRVIVEIQVKRLDKLTK